MSATRSDSTPKQQKEFVKKGLDVPLREGTRWYPVAMDWWYSWRTYVGYDDEDSNSSNEKAEEGSESLQPGPIHNTELSAEPGSEELKAGLVEGDDFVLLPEPVFKRLKTLYGVDGPEFERKVIKQGGQTTMNQVELYPLKFIVYHCNADGAPDNEPSKTYLISRSETVSSAKLTLMSHLPASTGAVRFWLKTDSEDDAADADTNPDAVTTDSGEVSAEDDCWELAFANNNNPTNNPQLMTLLPFGTTVAVMIERRIGQVYPRDKILNRWRNELKVGDLVDAIDTDRRWFASEILEKNDEKREVKVHFQGWSSKWDVWVGIDSDNIQKLYTHTPRWREALEVGSVVELKVVSGDQPRWFEAKVLAVDGDKVTVTAERGVEKVVVDRWSEQICDLYTHIKQKAKPNPTAYYSSTAYSYGRSNTKGTPPIEGAVGLSNLGNTCFMNSMLQCISNTEGLTDYFLNDNYLTDVNRDNPLGMGGKLATAYAKLLKDLWSGKYKVVVPTDFKRTIGDYAPQFAGYQQQDSQELMSFLLDGLHEDLNRVRKKPYVETVESRGRPDELVARESWRRFLLRNDSAVVDQCYGLLKSHVKCAGCGYESITFDPYLSLSLPIPVQNQRELVVTVYPLPIGTRPVRIRLELPLVANVMDLKSEIIRMLKDDVLTVRSPTPNVEDGATEEGQSEQQQQQPQPGSGRGTEPASPGVADGIYLQIGASFSTAKHRIYRTSEDRQAIQDAFRSSDEITAFQLEDFVPPKVMSSYYATQNAPAAPPTAYKTVDILIGQPGKKTYYSSSTIELVGPPFRISFHEDATRDEVRAKVWESFKRFIMEDAVSKYSADNTPYDLHVSASTGTTSKGKFEAGTEKAVAVITAYDALTIVLSPEAEDDIDRDEFDRITQHPSFIRQAAANAGHITLEQCFGKFVEREQLGAQELWFCPSCKNHLAPIKKIDIWAAPDVLIIHLKRFQYIPGAYFVHREKINELVSFPVDQLDLSDYVIGPHPDGAPPVYELYGVSEHSGGLGGGHYTAAAMNPRDRKWYSFNDSHVSPTTVEGHVSPRAYVLFYRRKHGSSKWAGITPLEEDLEEKPAATNDMH